MPILINTLIFILPFSVISKLPIIGAQDRLQPLLSRVSYKGRGQRSRSNGLRPVCTLSTVIFFTKAIVNWLTLCVGHQSKELEYHPRFHNYPWAGEWQLGGPWRGLTPEDYNVDGPVLVILILVLKSIIWLFIITKINFSIITWSGITPEYYKVGGLFFSILTSILLNTNMINHHHHDCLQHLHYNSNRGGSHLITSMLFEGG